METKQLLEIVQNLTIHTKDGRRSPHKPLMLLYGLGQWQSGRPEWNYGEIEQPMKQLLLEFAPYNSKANPSNPFWRLRKDGVFSFQNESLVSEDQSGNPSVTLLRKPEVQATFSPEISDLLQREPESLRTITRYLLEANFPEKLHETILSSVGLDLEPTLPRERRRRDPEFRKKILRAYEHRCAVCQFGLQLDGHSFGIEAAHIQWHTEGGPDVISNGLALCPTHHTLFDYGAFMIDDDLLVGVSQLVTGFDVAGQQLKAMHGLPIGKPTSGTHDYPAPEYLAWHRREVFKGEVRG